MTDPTIVGCVNNVDTEFVVSCRASGDLPIFDKIMKISRSPDLE